MSITVDLDEHRQARVSDQRIEPRPPNALAFVAEGVISLTEGTLSEFAGTSLNPVEVAIDVEDATDPVSIDLTGEASLRLESVDVGIQTPDADDIPSALDPMGDEGLEAPDTPSGAVAFTVEGKIMDVPEPVLESLSERAAQLASVTFAVDETVRGDGGNGDEALLEVTILGFGIVVYRSGVIEIGTGEGLVDQLPS